MTIKYSFFALILVLSVSACDQTEQNIKTSETTKDLDTVAKELAQSTIIVDGHIDVPYRLNNVWDDVTVATEGGDFDYPRAMTGGLNAPFMSIYTPASMEAEGTSKAHADKMIDIVEKIVATAPDKFTIVRNPDEVEAAFKNGLIALPLGMENGSPIEGDMANLMHFYERGIRYITLAHSLSNHLSDSSYDKERKWNGLSEFGVQVVEKMNELGIMVDVSHLSDKAFWHVLKVSKAPVIASHSSARHFVPGFERNMDDEMIKALGKNGGVIMINYGSGFITEAANVHHVEKMKAYKLWLEDNKLEAGDEHYETFAKTFRAQPFADISDVLNHIEHVIKLTGSTDFVGLGSDYDGVGDSLPTGLKDVSTYPNLVKGLLERGYSADDVKKILSGNVMRVWRQVEAQANR